MAQKPGLANRLADIHQLYTVEQSSAALTSQAAWRYVPFPDVKNNNVFGVVIAIVFVVAY